MDAQYPQKAVKVAQSVARVQESWRQADPSGSPIIGGPRLKTHGGEQLRKKPIIYFWPSYAHTLTQVYATEKEKDTYKDEPTVLHSAPPQNQIKKKHK